MIERNQGWFLAITITVVLVGIGAYRYGLTRGHNDQDVIHWANVHIYPCIDEKGQAHSYSIMSAATGSPAMICLAPDGHVAEWVDGVEGWKLRFPDAAIPRAVRFPHSMLLKGTTCHASYSQASEAGGGVISLEGISKWPARILADKTPVCYSDEAPDRVTAPMQFVERDKTR